MSNVDREKEDDGAVSKSNPDSAKRSSVAGEPARFRMVLVSVLSGAVGLMAGFVAFALYRLIGLFTNLFFFHRWTWDFISPRLNSLGPWVIVVPVLGGIVVGFMVKYGTPKIKGHGIP
jgi:CIC family chloride channel protein